jgi:hypothetical protein
MTCCHHNDDVVLEWLWWCSDGVDILSPMALLIEVEIAASDDVAVIAALVSSSGAAAVAEVTHVE